MNKQLRSCLGLASKANKILYGEKVLEAIRNNKVYLVLIASDVANNTKKKIANKAIYYHIPYAYVASSDELSQAVGKNNRAFLAITNQNLARLVKNNIKEGIRYGEEENTQ